MIYSVLTQVVAGGLSRVNSRSKDKNAMEGESTPGRSISHPHRQGEYPRKRPLGEATSAEIPSPPPLKSKRGLKGTGGIAPGGIRAVSRVYLKILDHYSFQIRLRSSEVVSVVQPAPTALLTPHQRMMKAFWANRRCRTPKMITKKREYFTVLQRPEYCDINFPLTARLLGPHNAVLDGMDWH
jgi:hypothetical protein